MNEIEKSTTCLMEYFKGNLNVPAYQNGRFNNGRGIWSLKKRAKLITRMLRTRNNFIPALTLHPHENDPRVRDILDGLQRILTVVDFMQNKFPIKIKSKPYLFKELKNDEQDRISSYPWGVELFQGTLQEAAITFKDMNASGSKPTMGETLRCLEISMPAWECLVEMVSIFDTASGDVKRSRNWQCAAFLLANAGATFLKSDTAEALYSALEALSMEEGKKRVKSLEIPIQNGERVFEALEKQGATRHQSGTIISQIALAYMGLPPLTYGGPEKIATAMGHKGLLQVKGRKSGSHPFNFSREENRTLFKGLREFSNDESVFCDPLRTPSLKDQQTISDKSGGKCVIGNHAIKAGEENYHHIDMGWKSGIRSNAVGCVLMCKDHHTQASAEQITQKATVDLSKVAVV